MEKIRAIVVGDPHFKLDNSPETTKLENLTLEIVRTQLPDFIVILGDTLDRHDNIHPDPLSRAVKFLHSLSSVVHPVTNREIPVYLLIGNHDLRNNQQFLSDEHPFTALKYWGPRLTVVDQVITHSINNIQLTFVPYVPNGRFLEALETSNCEELNWRNSKVIFCHQEFRGVDLSTSSGLKSKKGDHWSLEYPSIISGHIHQAQQLGNISYLGTPFQHSFGECGDPEKAIYQVSINSTGIERIEPYFLGINLKLTLTVDYNNIHAYDHQVMDYVSSGYQLRVIIRGTKSQLQLVNENFYKRKWEFQGVKVIKRKLKTVEEEAKLDGNLSFKTKSFAKTFYDVIKDDKEMVNLFTELFGEVRS